MSHTEHARQLQEASNGLKRDAQRRLQQGRELKASSQARRAQSHHVRQADTSRHRHGTEHGPRPSPKILSSPRTCPEARRDRGGCYG
jgi:hypothetical protein